MTYKSINLTNLFLRVWEPVVRLSTALRETTELIESTRLFCSLNELFCPDVNGRYFFKKMELTWQKVTERVCFAAHTFFKMLTGLRNWGLIDLGKIALYGFAQLPIFKMVTDGLFAATSFFCVWDSKRQLDMIAKLPEKQRADMRFQQQSYYMKIITYTTKTIIIPLSMVFVILNLNTVACSFTLLTLGVIGDAVGLYRILREDFGK